MWYDISYPFPYFIGRRSLGMNNSFPTTLCNVCMLIHASVRHFADNIFRCIFLIDFFLHFILTLINSNEFSWQNVNMSLDVDLMRNRLNIITLINDALAHLYIYKYVTNGPFY